ncbi:unnamed protein product, partial [Iphiclides podalirius]
MAGSCTTSVNIKEPRHCTRHRRTPHAKMIHHAAIVCTVLLASQCLANPVADPDPFGTHRTHVRIHVPYEVHTLHHHHIEKVPVIKEVPVIREVPVVKEVPVIKTVPVFNTVHVPVVNTVAVEKPVFIPYHVKESLWH